MTTLWMLQQDLCVPRTDGPSFQANDGVTVLRGAGGFLVAAGPRAAAGRPPRESLNIGP